MCGPTYSDIFCMGNVNCNTAAMTYTLKYINISEQPILETILQIKHQTYCVSSAFILFGIYQTESYKARRPEFKFNVACIEKRPTAMTLSFQIVQCASDLFFCSPHL